MLQIHKMNTFIMLYYNRFKSIALIHQQKKVSTLLGINSLPPEDRPLEVWRFLVEITIFRGY